jgi:hypothetical protein
MLGIALKKSLNGPPSGVSVLMSAMRVSAPSSHAYTPLWPGNANPPKAMFGPSMLTVPSVEKAPVPPGIGVDGLTIVLIAPPMIGIV